VIAPGTVVAPIMFHSIRPYGEEPGEASAINRDYFDATIRLAENLGFETITSEELAAFLENNAKIPARSMLLILDDRRPGTAENYFLPVLQANDWTTTLAWPIGDTDSRTGLWEWMERLNETGYFDIQSHGLNHIYLTDTMPESQVREEVFGSIPILEEHFNQTPIAYIWPGGNYTAPGIEFALEAGFEIGFTVHARGPIMFNWIPQGEQEIALDSPVMLLPRFWSPAALLNLEQSAAIGNQAQLFAKENYPAEAAWYQENCGAQLADLSEIFKDK
jgi:peptidoglycan/xylan/chitin deacetylase (PgdA/CDA1 family)